MGAIRLALLALCLWQVVASLGTSEVEPRKPWTPRTSCPEECTCSASSLTVQRIPMPKTDKQMAVCSSIPKGAVASSIYSIKVNGDIDKVTPALMAPLGKYLEVLDLSDCGITHIVRGSFDKLVKLSVLKLSNNKIETIDHDLFKKTGQLKKLFLAGNLIKEIQPGTFVKCNNLEELHLEMNQLREFPSKLPQKLNTLDVSHNDIMVLNPKDMGLMHLKLLNLCYNHIETWAIDVFHSLRMMHDLCLGTEQVMLPSHTAEKIPNIAHLKLIGEIKDPLPLLSNSTQKEIGKMNHLTTLLIENYMIGSLEFLLNHTNLEEIQFVNVNVTSTNSIEMKQIFAKNPYLTKINFNRSPNLADLLVNNIYMVANLRDLQQLSMQSSEIVHLPTSFDAPNSNFRLDISHNPLHCDCQFKWLHQMDTDSMHYLLASSENTTCLTPETAQGKTLEDFVITVNCTTGPGTEQPQVEEEEHTEMFNSVHHDDDISTEVHGTDNVEEHDQTNIRNLSGEEAAKTDENGENVTYQKSEDHSEGEIEQTGETEVEATGSGETDGTKPVEDQDSHSTDNQTDYSSEMGTDNKENGDQEQQKQETHTEDGTGEHNNSQNSNDETNENGNGGSISKHHRPRSGNDEHAKIYIVLGCVLLVLVLIGVILGVVYWKYKQDGKNKVAPGSTEPPNEPIEPTYKQTLASEDTTLIKK